MDKFYQACFNRLGRNEATAGWQLLNMSPDIPLHLKSFYENSQRTNQPVEIQTPKDQMGNDLCMLEVLCDGNNVGISRVQYGMSDAFGRDNMFCHGYLFSNAYEMLKDPNNILRISNSNFRFTPEDTVQIPATLELDEPWSVETALNLCGMDKHAYIEYISCLYYSLSSNAKTTIYVKTNGTDQMVRALLYLAYSAVPYSLRTKISAATFGGTMAVNARLIFTAMLPETCSYVEASTGDNNILTSNLRNRWKRYPFVDFYAQHYEQLAEKSDSYYGMIEKWLTRMGDPYMQNMDAIRLAFDMMRNKDDTDIAGLLYDWLMLPVPSNETIEQSLAELLYKAIELGIDLGRDKEELLFQRLEQTKSRELIRLGNQYQAKQLIKRPLDDAVNFLHSLTPEGRIFNTMRENLAVLEGGLGILREFYLQNARQFVSNRDLSYAELEELAFTFSDLPHMEQVWDIVMDRALQVAIEEIHKGASYNSAAKGLGKFMRDNYRNVDWEYCLSTMADAYDREFRQNFVPERIDEYIEFYRDRYRGHIERFDYSVEMVKSFDSIRRGSWTWAANFAANGCPLNGIPMMPIGERAKAIRNIMAFALYCNAPQRCLDINFWCQMAQALRVNPVQLMIENRARVFCDQSEFLRSISEDPSWTDEMLEWMCNQYRDYAEAYSDSTYKKNLELLNAEIKYRAEEAKKILKEKRRQEKGSARGKSSPRGVVSPTEGPRGERWDDEVPTYPEEKGHSRWLYTAEDTPDGKNRRGAQQEKRGTTKKEPEQEGVFSSFSKFLGGIGGRGKK